MNKNKYTVSILHHQTYDGVKQVDWEEVIGTTWAKSERQAINNIRFRNGITRDSMDCYGEGYVRRSEFVARLA